MLYGMIRAIIQDLRAASSQKHKDMGTAYDLAMTQPSEKSLRYCERFVSDTIRLSTHPSLRASTKLD
jgi:hypothetical protein